MRSGRRRARAASKPSAGSRSPPSRQGATFTSSGTSSIPRDIQLAAFPHRGSARIASPASRPLAIAWRSWGCRSTSDRCSRQARQESGRSIGRPQIARAMVDRRLRRRHARSIRSLARDRPSRVRPARRAVARRSDRDRCTAPQASRRSPIRDRPPSTQGFPRMSDAGLDALEAYHPDHDRASTEHYRMLADDLKLLVTGGSDFHGDPSHGLRTGRRHAPRRSLASPPRRRSACLTRAVVAIDVRGRAEGLSRSSSASRPATSRCARANRLRCSASIKQPRRCSSI